MGGYGLARLHLPGMPVLSHDCYCESRAALAISLPLEDGWGEGAIRGEPAFISWVAGSPDDR